MPVYITITICTVRNQYLTAATCRRVRINTEIALWSEKKKYLTKNFKLSLVHD